MSQPGEALHFRPYPGQAEQKAGDHGQRTADERVHAGFEQGHSQQRHRAGGEHRQQCTPRGGTGAHGYPAGFDQQQEQHQCFEGKDDGISQRDAGRAKRAVEQHAGEGVEQYIAASGRQRYPRVLTGVEGAGADLLEGVTEQTQHESRR